MRDDRREVLCGPSRRRGGDDTGDLAHHIPALRDYFHIPPPLREVRCLYIRVAAVIQDEARLRAHFGQLCSVGQVLCSQAEVEAHSELAEETDTADEFRLETVTFRNLAMEHGAESLYVRAAAETPGVHFESGVGRVAADD